MSEREWRFYLDDMIGFTEIAQDQEAKARHESNAS